ncbi:MAG: hypothetical protein ABIH11_09285 [Candidatus Altiarchaeota archaeon]
MKWGKVLRNWKVVLWAVSVFFSLLLISNIIPMNGDAGVGLGNGIDYGLDFAGGIELQLQLEKPLRQDIMAVERGILENRLNSMGLKDIPIRSWGDQYILIQIAGASPEEVQHIENILKQQARFEERIDGELAVLGDEITVDLGPSGTELYPVQNGFTWAVRVRHDKEGACRFGKVGDGKRGRPVDIFVDRPVNTTIIVPTVVYGILDNLSSSQDSDRIFYGDSALNLLVNRSRIPVIAYSNDRQALKELNSLKIDGFDNVLLAGDDEELPEGLRNKLEENGFNTVRVEKGNISYGEWIMGLTGLKSSPKLNFETKGECIYNAEITGSDFTLEEARKSIQTNQILLTSGNLPAKAIVGSKSTTPPTLGMQFLKYSFMIGVIALLTVGVVIYLRYRRLSVSIPIILTDVSEVVIVLGLASILNWSIDLPSVAGIIAAVGTGVNDQIVITDETMMKKRHGSSKKREIVNVSEQIRRAFFVIFTAAATIIAAMLPILSIGAGMLKGFAFTTIMGVLVGILITRPGYAVVLRHVLEED